MQRRHFNLVWVRTANGQRWQVRSNVQIEPAEGDGGIVTTDIRMFSGVASKRYRQRGVIATRTTLRGSRYYQYVPGGSDRLNPTLWRSTVREAAQDAASHAAAVADRFVTAAAR